MGNSPFMVYQLLPNMSKLSILFISTIVLAGCFAQQPLVSEQPKNNKTYVVEYLFEHDGCKVYRFSDFGNWVYFTNCNGETVSIADSTRVRNTIKVDKKNR